MTVESKSWEWSLIDPRSWQNPADEIHALLFRWKSRGFKSLLDLGCGLGRHALFFARNGFSVFAFDLSLEAAERLRKNTLTEDLPIQVDHGDMIVLPYETNSLDTVLSYHVIYHSDTEGVQKTVDEMIRVLKPGGEFFLTLGSKLSPAYASHEYEKIDPHTIVKNEVGPEYGVPHFFTDKTLLEELFRGTELITIRHIEECLQNGSPDGKWRYFILGKKKECAA